MRLVEDGVFNTEALKYSVKRLNQLGYFKALEGKPGTSTSRRRRTTTNKVDVKLKLEEQNRNQLTFGAGVSQFEGFFGQLSFQTANFLGRGESLTLSLQAGSRAQNYSLGVHRAVPVRPQHHRRRQPLPQPTSATSASSRSSRPAASLTFGLPARRGFTRMFTNYSYERVRVTEINDGLHRPDRAGAQPVPARLAAARRRTASASSARSSPSIVYNTVDQPIFPTTGKRFTASIDLAGLGGNTNFFKPMRRRRLVLEAEQPAVARHARRRSSTSTRSAASQRAADLREAVPRRRVQRPRLRHPDRSARRIR